MAGEEECFRLVVHGPGKDGDYLAEGVLLSGIRPTC